MFKINTRTRARSGALAGVTAGLAATGLVLIADAQDLYSFASEQHDNYLSSTVPADILWAKELRDDSLTLGRQRETAGWGLVAGATGFGIATLISAISGSRRAPAVQVAVTPNRHGLALGFQGSW